MKFVQFLKIMSIAMFISSNFVSAVRNGDYVLKRQLVAVDYLK
jgi:hypothetical protein